MQFLAMESQKFPCTFHSCSMAAVVVNLVSELFRPTTALGGLFGPSKGLIGGLSPLKRCLKGICPRNFAWEIDRKMPGKHVKNLQRTSRKLLNKKTKLQINQSDVL